MLPPHTLAFLSIQISSGIFSTTIMVLSKLRAGGSEAKLNSSHDQNLSTEVSLMSVLGEGGKVLTVEML